MAVAHRLAQWDFLDGLPHAKLEGGSTDIKGQLESDSWSFDESHDLSDGLFELLVAPDQVRLRKLILEAANQRARIVAKRNGAYALIRNRHQDRT